MSGGAGEFGHASGYVERDLDVSPDKRLRIARDAFLKAPLARSEGGFALAAHYDDVAERGRQRGLSGLHLMDHWYVYTRFRRWGGGNLATDVVLPLTCEPFLLRAFSLSPQRRLTADLHRLLVKRLKPEWADVPFFFEVIQNLAVRERTNTGSVPFIWETRRWTEVMSLLESTIYEDVFDRDEVLKAFSEPNDIPGVTEIRAQVVLDRILWRIGFDDYRRRAVEAMKQDS